MTVVIEEPLYNPRGSAIFIYLDRRDAPTEQGFAANTRLLERLRISIWCFHFGLDLIGAIEARDDLLGNTEVALMTDDTFSGAADASWITGGEFLSALTEEEDFMSGAEIVLMVDAILTTT